MALVIEDGTGLANAESYVSPDELTTYLDAYQLEGPRDEAEQEIYLRKATRAIDLLYPFLGDRVSVTQALHFPIVDADLVPVVISNKLKMAVCELVVAMYAGLDPLAPLDADAGLTELTEKVGELSVTKKWATGQPARQVAGLRTVDALLWGLYYVPAGADWYQMEVVR
jgi:hypothetical protein